MLGVGYVISFWHSLCLPYNYLMSTLSYMSQSFNENKQPTSDSFNTIMTRIVNFNFELNKLASDLSNTQKLDDPAILNIAGDYSSAKLSLSPKIFPGPANKFEFIRPEATQNQNAQSVSKCSKNNGPFPVEHAKS